MERVNTLFKELESRMFYLSNSPEIPDRNRESLIPVLASLLEAENNWRLFVAGVTTQCRRCQPCQKL